MKPAFLLLAFAVMLASVNAASCQVIYTNGAEDKNINVVFIGEGYSDGQTADNAKFLIDSVFGLNGVKPYADRAGDFNFFLAAGLEDAKINCPAEGECGIGGRGSDECENSLRKAVLSACPNADLIILLSAASFNPFTSGVRGDMIQLSTPYSEKAASTVSDYLKTKNVNEAAPSASAFNQMTFAHELSHAFGLYDEYAIQGTNVITGCPVSTGIGDNGAGYPNCQDAASAANGFWWQGFVGQGFGGNKILDEAEQTAMRNSGRQSMPFDSYKSCMLTRDCSDYAKFLASMASGYCLKTESNYRPSPASLMMPDFALAYAFEKPAYREAKQLILGAYDISKVDEEISQRLAKKAALAHAIATITVPAQWVSGSEKLALKQGYNLVNMPFLLVDSVNSSDCQSRDMRWLQYDRSTNDWLENGRLQGGSGYLVYAKRACSLTVHGNFYYGAMKLTKGWNLAAFPLAKEYTGGCDFQKVLKLVAGSEKVEYEDVLAENENYVVNIKDAVWMYVKDDCVMTPTVWPWQ